MKAAVEVCLLKQPMTEMWRLDATKPRPLLFYAPASGHVDVIS